MFQKKLHLIDEMVSKWTARLEPFTTVTLFLQKELDKYAVSVTTDTIFIIRVKSIFYCYSLFRTLKSIVFMAAYRGFEKRLVKFFLAFFLLNDECFYFIQPMHCCSQKAYNNLTMAINYRT